MVRLNHSGKNTIMLTTPEEALANAKIYGFTPEEALADAHFQIAMLQSNQDELEDRHEAVKRNKRELEAKLAERTRKLQNCDRNSPT